MITHVFCEYSGTWTSTCCGWPWFVTSSFPSRRWLSSTPWLTGALLIKVIHSLWWKDRYWVLGDCQNYWRLWSCDHIMIMIWWHLHFQNNQAAPEKPGTGSIHQYFHNFNRAGYRIHYKSARVLHSTKLGQISRDQIFSLKLWPEKEFLKLELGQKKGKLSQLRWIHQSQFLPQFQSYWF